MKQDDAKCPFERLDAWVKEWPADRWWTIDSMYARGRLYYLASALDNTTAQEAMHDSDTPHDAAEALCRKVGI